MAIAAVRVQVPLRVHFNFNSFLIEFWPFPQWCSSDIYFHLCSSYQTALHMKWGFMGFGNIAPKFLKSLQAFPDQMVAAIATKSGKETASQLCPGARLYDDYRQLAEDDDIDIIYISTTHNFHEDQVLMSLASGKHVLCEKPMALNMASALKLSQFPRKSFLMEAMWTRFLPGYKKAMELISEGLIGEVHWMQANFAFDRPGNPDGRHRNPLLAGGALYDIGIYPLAMALDLAGNVSPTKLTALANFTPENVDMNLAFNLSFKNGFMAQGFCAFDKEGTNDAVVMGKTGSLTLKDFWRCQQITHEQNGELYTYYLPFTETGYYHEIEECIQCIRGGKLESKLMSLEHSLLLSSTMEQLLNMARLG